MRILVISDLPQFVTGGAEIQASRLIEAWLDQGHDVICLGRRMKGFQTTIGKHALAVEPIRTIRFFGRIGRALSYSFSLAFLLIRYRNWADVIYTRFLGEAAATAALLKQLKLLSVPVVATPANTHGEGDATFLKSIPFSRSIIQLLDRKCDAINLIAEDMAEELQAIGFSGRNFSHIPNGIPVKAVGTYEKNVVPQFVAVGRLAQQKGYDILLAAVGLIRDFLHSSQIRVIGSGPELDVLRAISKCLGIEDKVEWLGELNQLQVVEQLDRANIFLLPSRYEGFSNAGLEAMERGLPLILTRCGGIDKHVDEQSGWVVETQDAKGLADAMLQALNTSAESLSAMGGLGRECVERLFDIKITSRRYVELFENLKASSMMRWPEK
jgi:glycosyltransferase involved in cell wall biosynthesis